MRILLIPALALIMGYPAFAKDGRQDWKYRTRRPHGPEIWHEHEPRARRDWDHPRFEHRRPFRHHGRERVIVHPAPVHVHPLPLPPPPPPPVGIHVWFGF